MALLKTPNLANEGQRTHLQLSVQTMKKTAATGRAGKAAQVCGFFDAFPQSQPRNTKRRQLIFFIIHIHSLPLPRLHRLRRPSKTAMQDTRKARYSARLRARARRKVKRQETRDQARARATENALSDNGPLLRRPCDICGGIHWRQACPELHAWEARRRRKEERKQQRLMGGERRGYLTSSQRSW
jgi:hypothetical protein